MFDSNFTFAAPPRSPSLDSNNTTNTRETSRSVSPCSPINTFPRVKPTLNDLAAQFADSRIRQDSRIHHDACASYANTDSDDGWAIPPAPAQDDADMTPISRARTVPARPQSPSRRVQRQTNTRLMCTTSHAHDIAALVSRMVESREQCTLSPPENMLSVPSTEPDEDEGYTSSCSQSRVAPAARPRPEHRRSGDILGSGACVNKSTRFRRNRSRARAKVGEK